MSIGKEYKKYCAIGGTLTKDQYRFHLDDVRDRLGRLINPDPTNRMSDIGERIFGYLQDDFATAISFSRASKGLYIRSRQSWFISKPREIILKYIKQGTSYSNYVKDEGWKDFIILSAKTAGMAVTVAAGVKAGIHRDRIPADAPTKTTTGIDVNGNTYEITYIDHPEAAKARMWTTIAVVVGAATTAGIFVDGIKGLLSGVDLDLFFSAAERDIVGKVKFNLGIKLISPNFAAWKVDKMKNKLISNPPNWRRNPELIRFVCPISNDFMLFPVRDNCPNGGHYFDYRSIRGYQLKPTTRNPSECPISRKKPNNGLVRLRFDKVKFDEIQNLIFLHNHPAAQHALPIEI